MDITHRAYADVVVVAPAGRLDHTVAEEFERSLLPLLDPAAGSGAGVVLDFARVEYISSVGLRVLMIASKEMRKHGARIILASPQPTVTEILSISRFDRVLEIAPSVRKAVGWISQPALAAYEAGPGKSAKP